MFDHSGKYKLEQGRANGNRTVLNVLINFGQLNVPTAALVVKGPL